MSYDICLLLMLLLCTNIYIIITAYKTHKKYVNKIQYRYVFQKYSNIQNIFRSLGTPTYFVVSFKYSHVSKYIL